MCFGLSLAHFSCLSGKVSKNVTLQTTQFFGIQDCSAIARKATILDRIVSGNAKFWDRKMLRDRTRGGHFGSLNAYHSGANRFGEREIPGSKHAPRSHAGGPFRLVFQIPFWSVSLRRTRNSRIQRCSAIARGATISARFLDTILERIA